MLVRNKPDLADEIGALGWVADGVDDSESDALEDIINFALRYEATARALLDMPWLADSVSDAEALAIAELRHIILIAKNDLAKNDLAKSVLALSWLADGVSDSEADSIYALRNIDFRDADEALKMVGMPFLQTLEGADVQALDTLSRLSADTLGDLLSLPTLKDGITDDDAPVIDLAGRKPDVVGKALASESTMFERRTVDLPLAGEVDLAIVRTRPNARRGMYLFENAVREAENLMGEPFPARYRYIGLLYKEDAVASGYTSGISRITIHSELDADDSRWGRLTLAHEVAHFYWFWGAGWINEGMAQLMASAIENRRVGTPIDFTYSGPCEFARTVTELEALSREQYRACYRWIGEGLFVSLLRTLGEDAFWEGARRLYVASLDAGGGAGIDEVRQAFGADASDVIDRWYGGN